MHDHISIQTAVFYSALHTRTSNSGNMLFERWDTSLNENEGKIVAEKILHYINSLNIVDDYYIMLKNWQVLGINDYAEMVKKGEVSPDDAFVYVVIGLPYEEPVFRYPFIYYPSIPLDAYISKLGLYSIADDVYYSVPANSLQYILVTIDDKIQGYSAIELIGLDTLAKNTKIKEILDNYMHNEIIDDRMYVNIFTKFKLQPLFYGYNFDDAEFILHCYYHDNNASLAEKVTRIDDAYNRVFRPIKVCFNLKTQSQVNCSMIKFHE